MFGPFGQCKGLLQPDHGGRVPLALLRVGLQRASEIVVAAHDMQPDK
jgi:hypothetical protein